MRSKGLRQPPSNLGPAAALTWRCAQPDTRERRERAEVPEPGMHKAVTGCLPVYIALAECGREETNVRACMACQRGQSVRSAAV